MISIDVYFGHSAKIIGIWLLVIGSSYALWRIFAFLMGLLTGTAGIMPWEYVGVVKRLGIPQKRLATPRFFYRAPFINTVVKMKALEQSVELNEQRITMGDVSISVDALISYKFTDPYLIVSRYENFELVIFNFIKTTVRTVLSQTDPMPFLRSNPDTNADILVRIADEMRQHGVEVLSVGFANATPPPNLQEAMAGAAVAAWDALKDLTRVNLFADSELKTYQELAERIMSEIEDPTKRSLMLQLITLFTALQEGGNGVMLPHPSVAAAPA